MDKTADEEMDVVAAIITSGEKILITKRPPGSYMEGKWELPGGKVEENETREEALIREIREELGRCRC